MFGNNIWNRKWSLSGEIQSKLKCWYFTRSVHSNLPFPISAWSAHREPRLQFGPGKKKKLHSTEMHTSDLQVLDVGLLDARLSSPLLKLDVFRRPYDISICSCHLCRYCHIKKGDLISDWGTSLWPGHLCSHHHTCRCTVKWASRFLLLPSLLSLAGCSGSSEL